MKLNVTDGIENLWSSYANIGDQGRWRWVDAQADPSASWVYRLEPVSVFGATGTAATVFYTCQPTPLEISDRYASLHVDRASQLLPNESLGAVSGRVTAVQLIWSVNNDVATSIESFDVQRRETGSLDWQNLATNLSGASSNYVDATVVAGKSYDYLGGLWVGGQRVRRCPR